MFPPQSSSTNTRLQYALRCKAGVFLKEVLQDGQARDMLALPGSQYRSFLFSSDGKTFFVVGEEELTAFDLTDNNRVMWRASLPYLQEALLAQGSSNLITTFQRGLPLKDPGIGILTGVKQNAKVLDATTGKVLYETASKCCMQFGDARTVLIQEREGPRILRFNDKNIILQNTRFEIGGQNLAAVDQMSLCGNILGLFCKDQSGKPGSVSFFTVQEKRLLAQRTLMRADRVDFHWSPDGTSALILAHAEIDKTNKSYYGQTHLFLVDLIKGAERRIDLDREGPVHDLAWHPRGTEFICVYGFMPSRTALFNRQGDLVYVVESVGPKNGVLYNLDGSGILFAAVGNLPTNLSIFSRHRMSQTGTMQPPNTTYFSWSTGPNSECGQLLLTATLTPRMRVDNGYRLWDWKGGELFRETITELYQIAWRPGYAVLIDEKTGKPASILDAKLGEEAVVVEIKQSAYVPPSMRNKQIATSSAEVQKPKSTAPPPPAPSLISKKERQIRKLTEKLDQIDDLKIKLRYGSKLEANQLEKISQEEKIRKELEALNLQP